MTNNVLNNEQKLNLQKMISANKCDDFTEKIRQVKQSNLIRTDVNHLVFLKNKFHNLQTSNPEEFDRVCVEECQFLFNNYTDIFNKVKKSLIDLDILNQFLNVLKQIEDGKVDQHEGSYIIGELLKKIYIDSALKREQMNSDNSDNSKKSSKKKVSKPKEISYAQYKNLLEKAKS